MKQPTLRLDIRIGVKVLEQNDFIRSLFADVVPLVMWTVVREQRLALELSSDVVGLNEIVFCHTRRVAERKRHGLDGVMDRAPGTAGLLRDLACKVGGC